MKYYLRKYEIYPEQMQDEVPTHVNFVVGSIFHTVIQEENGRIFLLYSVPGMALSSTEPMKNIHYIIEIVSSYQNTISDVPEKKYLGNVKIETVFGKVPACVFISPVFAS